MHLSSIDNCFGDYPLHHPFLCHLFFIRYVRMPRFDDIQYSNYIFSLKENSCAVFEYHLRVFYHMRYKTGNY